MHIGNMEQVQWYLHIIVKATADTRISVSDIYCMHYNFVYAICIVVRRLIKCGIAFAFWSLRRPLQIVPNTVNHMMWVYLFTHLLHTHFPGHAFVYRCQKECQRTSCAHRLGSCKCALPFPFPSIYPSIYILNIYCIRCIAVLCSRVCICDTCAAYAPAVPLLTSCSSYVCSRLSWLYLLKGWGCLFSKVVF